MSRPTKIIDLPPAMLVHVASFLNSADSASFAASFKAAKEACESDTAGWWAGKFLVVGTRNLPAFVRWAKIVGARGRPVHAHSMRVHLPIGVGEDPFADTDNHLAMQTLVRASAPIIRPNNLMMSWDPYARLESFQNVRVLSIVVPVNKTPFLCPSTLPHHLETLHLQGTLGMNCFAHVLVPDSVIKLVLDRVRVRTSSVQPVRLDFLYTQGAWIDPFCSTRSWDMLDVKRLWTVVHFDRADQDVGSCTLSLSNLPRSLESVVVDIRDARRVKIGDALKRGLRTLKSADVKYRDGVTELVVSWKNTDQGLVLDGELFPGMRASLSPLPRERQPNWVAKIRTLSIVRM